jgi:ABC-type Fe3+-hydroxamate transport system substrate-binding protein
VLSLCRAYADPGVLNRAEWVKFVAVFFNKEVEANNLFSNITNNLKLLNSTARAAAAKKAQPTVVAWLSKYGDSISVNFAAYKKQFIMVRGMMVLARLLFAFIVVANAAEAAAARIAWCSSCSRAVICSYV